MEGSHVTISFAEALKSMTTLSETMKQALLMERVKFIELMLMNGFVMRNFVTVDILKELYNDPVEQSKPSRSFSRSF